MTGIKAIAAIYIFCPECEEAITSDDGSQLIEESTHENMPSTIKCDCCGAKFRKPTWPIQRTKKAA